MSEPRAPVAEPSARDAAMSLGATIPGSLAVLGVAALALLVLVWKR